MRDSVSVGEAQNLYKRGYTVADISRKLGKSSSSVSRWCRKTLRVDRGGTSSQDKKRLHWLNFDKIDVGCLSVENCRLLVSLLYWCEGAKYPSSGELAFTSSDEVMQICFVKLLRRAYPDKIVEEKFRVVLQIPESLNPEETCSYWSKILNISLSQFYKPYITKTQGNRFRESYKGTCGLRYHDYRILLRIMGTYNQVAKQIIGGVA